VRHARRIFASSRMLAFTDQVSAPGDHRLALRLHFAPGLRLRRAERAWVVEDPSRHAVASIVGDDLDWRQTTSPYHPEFGREFERASLVASLGFRHASTLRWWLLLN